MRLHRRLALCVLIFFVFITLGEALEYTKGRIRIVLHEEIGRFTLYYLADLKQKQYRALFSDEDPRTSLLSILEGNNVHRIGDSYEFKRKAEIVGQGVRYVWDSNKLQIVEEFVPIASSAAPLEDGVKLTVSVENVSEQDLSIGVRFLFDTYLGEDKSKHFTTDGKAEITRELSIPKKEMIQYWVSPDPDSNNEIGLQCMTSGEGISVPDSIVFANWKRLNDSRWTYETNPSRTFMYPPFSFNDSAVIHYYDAMDLPKGATRSITIVLGNRSASGYDISGKQRSDDINTLLQQATSVDSETSNLFYSVQADLSTVNKLLETIDEKLSAVEEISDNDLELIEQILTELKERSAEYTEE